MLNMCWYIVLLMIILSGCASKESKKIEPIVIQVPIPIVCAVELPKEPVYNFPLLKKQDNIFIKTKTLLADRELHKGYETELLAALKSCK